MTDSKPRDGVTAAQVDLEAIEARANAATPGPWTALPPDEYSWKWFVSQMPGGFGDKMSRFYVGFIDDPAEGRADAEFIASARTDIPALIAEVRKLREALDAGEAVASQADVIAQQSTRGGGSNNDLRRAARQQGEAYGANRVMTAIRTALHSPEVR